MGKQAQFKMSNF